MNTERQYLERIVRDPAVLVGKPTIKGTRISVELILQRLAQNPDLADLFAAYPRLTVEDVKAALAYARAVLVGEESVPVVGPVESLAQPAWA